MPNWCGNYLRVTGRSDETKLFAEMVEGYEQVAEPGKENGWEAEYRMTTPLDFESTVPMPKCLRRYGSPRTDPYNRALEESRKTGDIVRDVLASVARHHEDPGLLTDDWYGWAIRNWSTKWNVGDEVQRVIGEGIVEYRFATAWGPPEKWLEKTSALFPSLRFLIAFDEPGCEVHDVCAYVAGAEVGTSAEEQAKLASEFPPDTDEEEAEVQVEAL